jgi:hypothetical protein
LVAFYTQINNCYWYIFIFKKTKIFFLFFFLLANISEEETQWKQEFRQYQERIQQWDYYYTKYLDLLEKNKDKLLNCFG